MRKWLVYSGFALLVLVIAAFIALASWEPFLAEESSAPPEQAYQAEIIRDNFGVPHIYGKTDADVAFGIAMAQAEDDFSTLQDVIAMSRGRYGAIAGQDGAAIDYVYHLLDARKTAERDFKTLPAGTQALANAYAAGLNAYAKRHPEELKLANLFPTNGTDIAAGFVFRQPFFFGLNNVIQPLVAGEPLRREYGPDIPGFARDAQGNVIESDMSAPTDGSAAANKDTAYLYSPFGKHAALAGSNAFAVAPQKSGGPTTLISNTHQPLRGPVAWYELVVESEEGWHFAGANFPGVPYPAMGHNRHLGWTYTVNRPDLVDVYQLELNEAGDQYRLDDEWRPLESKTVTLPVKLGPLVLPIRRTVYRSVHGPVIKNDQGAFAIRYAGIDSAKALDAFYRKTKAKTFEEWRGVMARRDIPSFNAVYADQEGNIAYFYNAALPDRKAGPNWRGILPGNDSELIWDGPVDYDRVPQVINPASGWVYNANNTPFTAAGQGSDLDPSDFAPELGVELKQTNRSLRSYKLMSEASLLDRENLERIKYDMVYERESYVDDLLDALERLDVEGDLAKARDLMLSWDLTADNKGAADAIALLMIRDFMSAEYQNRPIPDVEERLANAADHLMTHFGRLDPAMSELLRLRQGDVDLPLIGGSDTLRASTTWQVDNDGRLSLVHGDSFIQWVEWPADGGQVSSRSIQPFGAATTRPDSPHYTDQMQLYVDQKLKPVHFWREDVLANAAQRYTVESN